MPDQISPTIKRETFVPTPAQGIASRAFSFYTDAKKDHLTSFNFHGSRSDTHDAAFIRRSTDNGQTWSEPQSFEIWRPDGDGFVYLNPCTPLLDTNHNRVIAIQCQAKFDQKSVHQGLTRYRVNYKIYPAGQLDIEPMAPIICEGEAFDEAHPIPGVHIGVNSFLAADFSACPILRSDGVVLAPAQITPIDENGKLIDPYGIKKYRHTIVLQGRWRPDGDLAWTPSQTVSLDPALSTRGVFEPTLAELPDGRILMVMRGSNATREEIPGHKWFSISDDGGDTWPTPAPWSYTNGDLFYSPSACSQLIPLADGRLFWLGNICPSNPKGNHPRYPLVLVEVDTRSGRLIAKRRIILDDCGPNDSPGLQLSSIFGRQERHSGDLLIHTTRSFARPEQNLSDNLTPQEQAAAKAASLARKWTADADLLRVTLD